MDPIFTLRKLIRTDRKHWPVTVNKYEIYEDTLRETQDRGRRVKDQETEEPVYQFRKEEDTTTPIPRKYLKHGSDGHPTLDVVKIQSDEGALFAPVKKEVKISRGDLEEDEDLPEDLSVDFVINLSRFINIGKKELERHYEITKQEDTEWYQAPIIWLLLGSIGMGIFMVLAGIGAQKAFEPAAEASKNLLPLAMVSGKRVWSR